MCIDCIDLQTNTNKKTVLQSSLESWHFYSNDAKLFSRKDSACFVPPY